MPSQEIVFDGEHYTLVAQPPLPVEEFNAQISLMTGMQAAALMLEGKIGMLRTMPAPDQEAIDTFRAETVALGVPWSKDITYGEYLRSLEPSKPADLAAIHAATGLFRGAGYTSFNGEVPEESVQSAIASPYAHCTAPLRRLGDRYVLAICLALANNSEVPGWAVQALEELPAVMSSGDQLAGKVNRACVDLMEAVVLAESVGEVFTGVVIALGSKKNSRRVQLENPAITADVHSTAAPQNACNCAWRKLISLIVAWTFLCLQGKTRRKADLTAKISKEFNDLLSSISIRRRRDF